MKCEEIKRKGDGRGEEEQKRGGEEGGGGGWGGVGGFGQTCPHC